MAPPEPPTTISVKVKVPPGHLVDPNASDANAPQADEYLLGQLPTTANIGFLRHHIQNLAPTNPSPDRQRLLYAGRALVDNEQSLADALNTRRDPTQTEYVVHLLVKGDGLSNTQPRSVTPAGTSTATPRSGMTSALRAEGDGTSHRRTASSPSTPAPPNVGAAQPRLPPGFPTPQEQIHQSHMNAHHLQHMDAHHRQHLAHLQQQQILQHWGTPNNMQAQPPQQTARDGAQHTAQANGAHTAPPGETQNGTVNTEQPLQNQNQDQQQEQHPRPHGIHIEGVGPNGQHFQIHQQTVNLPFPGGMMPGHTGPFQQPGFPPHMQFGQPPMQLPPHMQFAQQPPMHFHPQQLQQRVLHQQPAIPPSTASALDEARRNMAMLRLELDALRQLPDGGPEQAQATAARIEAMQRRVRSINQYIDPFGVDGSSRPPQLAQNGSGPQVNNARGLFGNGRHLPFPSRSPVPPQPQAFTAAAQQQPSNPNNVTAYLLSSPSGPQALLLTPQHGAYTGTVANNAGSLRPTPTQPPPQAQPYGANDPVALAARQQIQAHQAQQAQQGQQDALAPLQPLLAAAWFWLRVMVFAYFMFGGGFDWRHGIFLAMITAGFWMIRQGLANGGDVIVRRWWDGVLGLPEERQGAQNNDAANAGGDGNANRPRMPTPEEAAQRLLDRNRQQQRGWLRERLRPVERAVALFVASLWPGLGEAHVRAREEERRRIAQEAEVERERVRVEEERSKEAAEAGGRSEEKKDESGEGSGSSEVKTESAGGEKSGGQDGGGSA